MEEGEVISILESTTKKTKKRMGMIINQTRIRDIPQRWKILTILDLSITPVSNGLYKSKDYYGKGPYMVHMGEIFAHDIIENQYMPRVYLTENEKNKYILKLGDLLFARRSLKLEGAGDVSIYCSKNKTSYESSIIRVRLNQLKAHPLFVFYYLKSEYGKAQMMSFVRQVAVSGITGEDLKKYQVPIPPLSEQKAIADTLQTWDTAIEKTEELIAAKEKQFEWLVMCFMESQKQYLTKLGAHFGKDITIEKGKSVVKDDVSEGNIPVIAGGKTSPYSHNQSTHSIPCITVSASGAAGYVWYHNYPIWASDCNVIYSDQHSTEYLYYALKSKQSRIYAFQSGSALPHIYAKDMRNISIPLPPLPEQKRIAYVLDTAQREINLLKQLVEKYRTQKRGLMQKLLTGKWRVKV